MLVFRLRVYGKHHVPADGPGLLVANHQSFMDPVLSALALPRECDFMARDTLFRNPLFKRLITSLNAFPVRRGEADLGAIKETLRRLKQGRLVVMFPEGTRSPDGRIGRMLPGLDSIARRARAPIIPVLIDGVFQAWPRTALLPRIGNVIVEYDKPILPAEYTDLSPEALMERIRGRLLTMQRRWHGRLPERRLEWFPEGG